MSDESDRVLDALACRAAHDDPELVEALRTGRHRRRRRRTPARIAVVALVALASTVLLVGMGTGLVVGIAAATITGGVVAAALPG